MIVICGRCKGTGQLQYNHGSHNSDWRTETCNICECSGRLVQKLFLDSKPFKPGKDSVRIF